MKYLFEIGIKEFQKVVKKMNSNEVKQISDIVGEMGKWQLNYIGFYIALRTAFALSNMGYNFHAYNNDFWCSDVPEDLPVIRLLLCFY